MTAAIPQHLLVFEPRTEGHHPGWLRFITEDLLSGGHQLTLAVDLKSERLSRIRDHLGDLISRVKMIDGCRERTRMASLLRCLRESGAASAFLCAIDEIASHCWRRAAFGIFPPPELRGRIGGIYHRPSFLEAPALAFDHLFKKKGYQRMLRGGWLRELLFVDEYIARDQQKSFPKAPIFFLPDPCPIIAPQDKNKAREELHIPSDKCVFLFYGGGYRRKGLHLAVEAMLKLPADSKAFLLCAGQLDPDGNTAIGLQKLEKHRRAKLMNRYVTVAEEAVCFGASDVVLLPYVHHFGTSGVMSRAMASRLMVIASDEGLLGRLTRDHRLGLLFLANNVEALRGRIEEACRMPVEKFAAYAVDAAKYASIYSREAYRAALLKSVASHG